MATFQYISRVPFPGFRSRRAGEKVAGEKFPVITNLTQDRSGRIHPGDIVTSDAPLRGPNWRHISDEDMDLAEATEALK